MKLKILVAFACLALFSGCVKFKEFQKILALTGAYRTDAIEFFDDGAGMTCDVDVKAQEQLSLTKMEMKGTMDLYFHFGGQLTFQDMALHYDFALDGQWKICGDSLFITPDTKTFKADFQSSNASTSVEQAMVRHLRKYVSDNVENLLKEKLSDDNTLHMEIKFINSNAIMGKADDRLILLQRVE